MVCNGYRRRISVDDRWPQKHTSKCLGHHFDSDGSIRSCYDASTAAMWRCFYGNMSSGLAQAPMHAKMRFLNTCISTIPSFRWGRWPYQVGFAGSLDRTQRRMIAASMDIKPWPCDDAEAFRRRRHTTTGRIAAQSGRWSEMWARSVRNWGDHVLRNHDPGAWSHGLHTWHGQEWIQSQRSAMSSSGESRTGTRALRSNVFKRWEDGYFSAKTIADPRRH